MQPSDSERKQYLAGVFDRAAPTYDRVGPRIFSRSGATLVQRTHVSPGIHALDIATGRGAVLVTAARAIGPTGTITGIDLSPAMVAHVRETLTTENITWADVMVDDAEHLPFADDTFDAVLSGFSIFFFADMPKVLHEWRRVLRADGRFGISTWGPVDEHWAWFDEMIRTLSPTTAARDAKQPTTQADTLQQLLEGAGFTNVSVTTEHYQHHYASFDEWWQYCWSHGGRGALERLSPERLQHFREEATNKIEALRDTAGYPETFTVHFATATK